MIPNKDVAAQIRAHLAAGGPIRRWIQPSLTREPGLTVSIIASHDQGTHASGWWRNSEYDRCWHLSLAALAHDSSMGVGYADLPDLDRRAWAKAVFREHLAISWTEPPASKLDIYRSAAASPYTTHIRVFLDRQGRPIKPTGEVYTLLPWAEGDSPAKVFRS